MEGMSEYQAKEFAQSLGSTHYRTYYTYAGSRLWFFGGERKPIPFMIHFFDDNDIEICYYSIDMGPLVGMTMLPGGRVWADEFKVCRDYSEPVDFTACACSKFSKDNIRKKHCQL